MLCRACISAGVLVSAGFAVGTLNSMDCPADYFRIVTEDVCRNAAFAAGQAYQGRETNPYNDSPLVCNLSEEGVFLNDASATDATRHQLLCSGARLSHLQQLWVLFASSQGHRWGTEVFARGAAAQPTGDRPGAAVRSAIPGPLRFSRVITDLPTPSSAIASRIGLLYAATASLTPTPTSPGDTNAPTASPTPSPTYGPDGTSALHPFPVVGTGPSPFGLAHTAWTVNWAGQASTPQFARPLGIGLRVPRGQQIRQLRGECACSGMRWRPLLGSTE
jgi:hypothetical protein